ncbi:type VII secretion protein EccE [Streptomyces sp. NPDC052077]|uniref:type VII secretion protein EccE n=1 Tax=Streptomyces sp. NPDC052077 TaxID=3154757 RepID=UPI0034173F38
MASTPRSPVRTPSTARRTGPSPAGGGAVDPGGSASPRRGAGGSASPRRGRTRGGRGGSPGLQRLLLLESAAAVLVCAWPGGPTVFGAAAAVAGVLLLLAVVRLRGRSLPEWLRGRLALRARLRRVPDAPLPPDVDPALAPAVECDPALRTYRYRRDDELRPVGMVGDGSFLTAVLRVESGAVAPRGGQGRVPLPLALVRDALEVDDVRLESAQVVLHTQPAPAPHLPRESVVVTNYAQLQGDAAVPAVRIVWIALKLSPELCPEAVAARGGGLTGAQKCLLRAADHLSSRLAGAGFRAGVLTEEELAAAIATSACSNPLVTSGSGPDGAAAPRRTAESGRSWRCDNRRHTTYWIRRWPRLGGAEDGLPELVARLTSVPALATTFSLTLAPAGAREVALTGHLRVTGRSGTELSAARRTLERIAREARTGVVRLDREQLPGVLATLPLGGAR